jgi:hypothetical protein
MYKLVPVLALIATVPISIDTLAAAELYSPGRLSGPSAVGIHGPDPAVVFVAGGGGGTGGGRGGGSTGGGMGGGSTGGGMGGGSTGGGSTGGGSTGGGMGGGSTGGGSTGGGMFGSPAQSFGGSGSSDWPGNSAQPSYYTYQCATPVGGCSFTAPAALRSTSLRAGARCACAVGQPEGQIR